MDELDNPTLPPVGKGKGHGKTANKKGKGRGRAKDEDEVEELPEINKHLMTKVTKLNEYGVL